MKTLLQLVLSVFLILAGVVVGRALLLTPEEGEIPPAVEVQVREGAVERFAGSLRFPTISHGDPGLFQAEPFLAFRTYLEETFPGVHNHLTLETVGEYSLLYTWQGSNPTLDPMVLMAHSDVVPVEPGTEAEWSYPPFAGRVVEEEVWGRGAMDDKASLLGILESAETLVERGFRPRRTLIFAFGHDEEIGGLAGARAMADLLRERGIRPAFVLDEGMAIVEGTLPGVEGPVALIGLAEKGYISIRLSVEVQGGHSSTPPAATAVGLISGAVSRLEENPMPSRLEGPSRMLLETVAPDMPFGMRLVMANLWLFEGTVSRLMIQSPETAAAVRTTTAPTLLRAGVKDNILPRQAFAVVNFRILPGDTSEDVLDHARTVVGDSRVKIDIYQGPPTEPSPVSSVDGLGYREVRAAVMEVFPGTAVAPFLTLGGTDSKHFVEVAEDVYRFAPLRYRPELAGGVHGMDERMPVGDYLDMVRFYTRLMERVGGGTGDPGSPEGLPG